MLWRGKESRTKEQERWISHEEHLCSPRGPKFNSKHPHSTAHEPSVTPLQGPPCAHIHMQTCTPTHKNYQTKSKRESSMKVAKLIDINCTLRKCNLFLISNWILRKRGKTQVNSEQFVHVVIISNLAIATISKKPWEGYSPLALEILSRKIWLKVESVFLGYGLQKNVAQTTAA